MRTLVAVTMLLALLLLPAVPTLAAGAYDGIWFVVESHSTLGVTSYYASVHQNNSSLPAFNIVFGIFQVGGPWRVGLAVLNGNTINGTTYDNFGVPRGSFAGTFTDATHLQGQASSGGIITTLTAQRLF